MKLKSLLVIVVLLGIGLWYFNYFDQPEDTMTNYANSVNNLDVEGMLDSLDPAKTKMARAGMKVMGAVSKNLIGIDAVDLLPFLPAVVDFARANDTDGAIPIYRFEYISTEMNLFRTEATVNAYLINDVNNEKQEGTFYLKKLDRKWRIMNIEDAFNTK